MAASVPPSPLFTPPPRPRHCPASASRSRGGTRQLLKQLDSTVHGLTPEVAAARLSARGPNLVAHERPQSLPQELLGKAKNPLNFLLLTLAAVSFFLGDTRAAAVIAVMVLLSVTLAFVQEHRSNNAAARLREMVRTTATVLRPRPGNTSGDLAVEFR
ncbi:MAG TPA: cation-transporting P-type ATPase [Stellaceae bacterium]|nr:cation-transporting P-type ATPase [Stellaceae bacterium]